MAVCKVCKQVWMCHDDPIYNWACECEEPEKDGDRCSKCDGLLDKTDKRIGSHPSSCPNCVCPDCRAKATEAKLKERGEDVLVILQPYIIEIAKRYLCPYCHRSQVVPFDGECLECKRKLAKEGREVEASQHDLLWR